ncbi:unnamed protein product [Amoebophrya sp. A120]|nr:unnamed protein product [Amoebophrya sp. A120]|eukprot:GSA120T00004006001.1
MIEPISDSDGQPTILVGLMPVLAAVAVREWLEDRARKRNDYRENHQLVDRYTQDGDIVETEWQDLSVGDVIRVKKGQQFPADLLLLASSDKDREQVFVETKNLDGETNLKTKVCLPQISSKKCLNGKDDAKSIAKLRLRIKVEPPCTALYSLNGQIFVQDEVVPLSADQLLLKGSSLQSDYAIGCVIYCGHFTRLLFNASNVSQYKLGIIQRWFNRHVIQISVMQVLFSIFVASAEITVSASSWPWYADEDVVTDFLTGFGRWWVIFGRQTLMLTFFVPISVIITVEIVRVVVAWFMARDEELMGDQENLEDGAKAQSTSVLEDLGSVSHIFSDKTGTLTENLMLFSCIGLPNDIRDGAWYNNPANHVDAKERASISEGDIKRMLGVNQFEEKATQGQLPPYMDTYFPIKRVERLFMGGDQDREEVPPQSPAAKAKFALAALKNKTQAAVFGGVSAATAVTNGEETAARATGPVSRVEGDRGEEGAAEEPERTGSFFRLTSGSLMSWSSSDKKSDALEKVETKAELSPAADSVEGVGNPGENRDFDDQAVRMMFYYVLNLALCHTVILQKQDTGEEKFEASSPDELALIAAAQAFGFRFLGRPNADTIRIGFSTKFARWLWPYEFDEEKHRELFHESREDLDEIMKESSSSSDGPSYFLDFEVLDVLEFDNVRKRMSVVIRMPADLVPKANFLFGPTAKSATLNSNPTTSTSQQHGVLTRSSSRGGIKSTSTVSAGGAATVSVPDGPDGGGAATGTTTTQHQAHAFDQFRNERTILLTKGADNSMLSVGSLEQPFDERQWLDDHILDFAKKGLRTLLLGYRWLSTTKQATWSERYSQLRGSIDLSEDDKKQQTLDMINEMEQNLNLVGCTGVEDKLQDQVPETIAQLQAAGIKFWVLTGDKVETAIQIGQACNLLNEGTYNLVLTTPDASDVEERLKEFQIWLDAAEILQFAIQSGEEDLVWSDDEITQSEESESHSQYENTYGQQMPSLVLNQADTNSPATSSVAIGGATFQQQPEVPLLGPSGDDSGYTAGRSFAPGSIASTSSTAVAQQRARQTGLEGVQVGDVVLAPYDPSGPRNTAASSGPGGTTTGAATGRRKSSAHHHEHHHHHHHHATTKHMVRAEDLSRVVQAQTVAVGTQPSSSSTSPPPVAHQHSYQHELQVVDHPFPAVTPRRGVDRGTFQSSTNSSAAVGNIVVQTPTRAGGPSLPHANSRDKLIARHISRAISGDRLMQDIDMPPGGDHYSTTRADPQALPSVRLDYDETTAPSQTPGRPTRASHTLPTESASSRWSRTLRALRGSASGVDDTPLNQMKKEEGRFFLSKRKKQMIREGIRKRYQQIQDRLVTFSSAGLGVTGSSNNRDTAASSSSSQQLQPSRISALGQTPPTPATGSRTTLQPPAQLHQSGISASQPISTLHSTPPHGRSTGCAATSRSGQKPHLQLRAAGDQTSVNFEIDPGDLPLSQNYGGLETPTAASRRTQARQSFKLPTSPSRPGDLMTGPGGAPPYSSAMIHRVIDPSSGEIIATTARSREASLFDTTSQAERITRRRQMDRGRSRTSMQKSTSGSRVFQHHTSTLSRQTQQDDGAPGGQVLLPEQQEENLLQVFRSCAITITGDVLAVILQSRKLRRFFFRIALQNCSVIIACRVSPIQKADIVALSRRYRQSDHNAMLAIGDGANDVGMILRAHVGVGISGKEGAAAAKSADFAISQFKHLKKLCFVYGRESMRRNALFVYYSLYKNVAFSMPSVFFSMVSRFSALDLYDPWVKQIFNTVFTFLPIVLYTIFDRELPYYYLLNGPPLYRPLRFGVPSTGTVAFWYWFWQGCWCAFICAVLPMWLFDEAPELAGTPAGYHVGTLVFTSVICSVTAILPIHHNIYFYFTIPGLAMGLLTFLWVWILVSETQMIGYRSTMYRTYYLLTWTVGSQFFLILIVTTLFAVLPHYIYLLRGVFFPDGVRIVKERIKLRVHDVLLLPDATNANTGPVIVPHKRQIRFEDLYEPEVKSRQLGAGAQQPLLTAETKNADSVAAPGGDNQPPGGASGAINGVLTSFLPNKWLRSQSQAGAEGQQSEPVVGAGRDEAVAEFDSATSSGESPFVAVS